ncbi:MULTISPECIES: hypothetical protein [Streptomyces]|uniref:Integral membrane protein n=1 Tax=Streptomyces caniscabiei TaxID=2746961 RepID=A0ABU4N3S2_9ACTN|nr:MULTISPECIES: hypothetical protein [Streptomyces]MBE4741142.1 hypothetical protein [Streptomyces caniscabiei]MBE4760793.1 hypothetical protein [Streptomyces caniscabiei]MBE4774777.1 hypothetical protein [Streptomyces caniscabiei]MBE4789535.1 hypothetical protein [Streptomyces caniscabiei]MBE4798796.1 hypothetical protein [Streptomyces caniscabiei]
MKTFITSKPVLWLLFLFNLLAAAVIPFVAEGAQALGAFIGMGLVSVKAGLGLMFKYREGRRRASHAMVVAQ